MHAIETLQQIWKHPANANRRFSGLIRYARWQLLKRVIGREMPFSYHGFVMPGYLDSHSMSAAYYFAGFPDWWEMCFIRDYLRPGDHFLDIGANVGLYSLLATSLVGAQGHVDAFEPAAIPSQRFQESIDRNDLNLRITIHRVAVTDQPGSVQFGFASDDCQSHVQRPGEESQKSTSVPAVTLDDYCRDRFYAMAKLDIEGHEPFALAGASKMLADGNPRVMQIEMAGYSKLFGVSTAEFVQRLSDLGYDCFYYAPDSRQLIAAPRPWEVPLDNVIAIFRDAMSVVEERLATAQQSFSE